MISESEYYGTLAEAVEYFEDRLHDDAWSESTVIERPKALLRATQIMDALNYKGYKAATYAVVYDAEGECLDPAAQEIRDAEISQVLEFPRGTDTEIPQQIKIACWEIAYALLDGVDPDLENENLAVVSQGYASVRTTYDRNHSLIEHLQNGIPSATAWRYLKPFLRDADAVGLTRI